MCLGRVNSITLVLETNKLVSVKVTLGTWFELYRRTGIHRDASNQNGSYLIYHMWELNIFVFLVWIKSHYNLSDK
jgi:hypothetical protein